MGACNAGKIDWRWRIIADVAPSASHPTDRGAIHPPTSSLVRGSGHSYSTTAQAVGSAARRSVHCTVQRSITSMRVSGTTSAPPICTAAKILNGVDSEHAMSKRRKRTAENAARPHASSSDLNDWAAIAAIVLTSTLLMWVPVVAANWPL